MTLLPKHNPYYSNDAPLHDLSTSPHAAASNNYANHLRTLDADKARYREA